MIKKLFATVFFLGFVTLATAQTADTVAAKVNADTIPKANPKQEAFKPKIKKEPTYHPDSTHSPSLAVKRSLFIPGWGQLYNKKGAWWKIPAIYAGLGALGYSIVDSHKNYQMFLALTRIKNTGKPLEDFKPGDRYYAESQKYATEVERYASVNATQLQEAASNYQRNFQISILSVLLVWGVQTVEAYIEAKFISSYTVDDNLSFKISPALINQPMYAATSMGSYIPGLKVTFAL
ncbi:hypothetical protein D0C36_11495 [Mucilaginibacter conchicola]|uniref:DUF5683 domain-containing protein n=1 Tax=Mucilaginibacter conchicola TaxID=2303333 RepID=A0A372NSW7_9SPHI|nr:DUF5683 domain-containing protein [Mucilaginibacter conchicola]RFZ92064.1 hypothetical protein D0C36_11495 [Mucilaginibacter conchicola]